MDTYFPGDIFWYDEPIPLPKASDFVRFEETSSTFRSESSNNRMNMNKRVIEFLGMSSGAKNIGSHRSSTEHEKERSFRHMMSERMRREKQKQLYAAVHSLLPLGTKNDKNTIVQTAAMKISELESRREKLMRRKAELEAVSTAKDYTNIEKSDWKKMIRVKLAFPTSGVDSMVELLNCLKRLDLKAKNIRSFFAHDKFSAEFEIETKVDATEIEEAIQVTLDEADFKLCCRFWD